MTVPTFAGSAEAETAWADPQPDPEAFGRFYDRHAPWVLRYFLSRTACSAQAADLCSETFASALQNRQRFDSDTGTEQQWLGGIARNVFRQFTRRGRVERFAAEKIGLQYIDFSDDDLARVDLLVDMDALRASLLVALECLAPDVRKLVHRRVIDGADYAEIAAEFGIREGTLRVKLSRALARLASHPVMAAWHQTHGEPAVPADA